MKPVRPRRLSTGQKGVDYADVVLRLTAGERVKDVAAFYVVTPTTISCGTRRHGWAGRYNKTPAVKAIPPRRAALIALFSRPQRVEA